MFSHFVAFQQVEGWQDHRLASRVTAEAGQGVRQGGTSYVTASPQHPALACRALQDLSVVSSTHWWCIL